MRANCWMGRNSVAVQNVPDPSILNRRDAIVKITSTAICGSDLHLLDGYVPTMQKGDVGPERLRHVQAQEGQLREGRPQAVASHALTMGTAALGHARQSVQGRP
jgi:threonine dehydrogenase-like Zn-dependent dehydrogenase